MNHTKTKNIALIGMMGCGKSSVAKELSSFAPHFKLIETDSLIEDQEGCTISQIFAQKGESYFRELETTLIKSITTNENQIISTGGGMFLREENQKLLKEKAFCIYLTASPNTIYERIKTDTNRPLLQCDKPEEKIKELLKLRNSAYLKAHVTIQTDNKTTKEIAQEIWEKYKKDAN